MGEGTNVSLVVRRGRGVPVSSMSAAVSNHQLPSYMSGFLYPLGNKKGVYSFVRCKIYDELLVEVVEMTLKYVDAYHLLYYSISVKRIFR